MRTLFMIGRELEYPRNDVLLRAFQRFSQVDVVGVNRRPASLLLNSLNISLKSLPKAIFGKYDLVFVGFYGHLIMLPMGLLNHKGVLFDAFVSNYDTLVEDRGTLSSNSLPGRMAGWLDRRACLSAGHVLLDTQLHADYFAETFDLPIQMFSTLPVGCNEDIFSPSPPSKRGSGATRVLYYSSYLPLHGVETIVKAAGLLKSAAIHFRLIGKGQEYERVRRMVEDLELTNVEFVPPVPLQQLPEELTAADICLGGHFGMSQKAGRVVPGKIYQVLAMARALIAGNTPANRALLTPGENACLCPPGDADHLAQSILKLHQDAEMRERLAMAGRDLYLAACSEAVITRRLQSVLLKQGFQSAFEAFDG